MASFLDYFVFTTRESTPLPTLRIHSDLCELQTVSESFFIIPNNAQAEEKNRLAVNINSGQEFRTDNSDHTQLIKNATALYAKKSQALYDLDDKIKWSLLVAVAAYSLSFLPVIGWITMAGVCAALYFSTQRAELYAEHQESLKLLVAVCNWSLGQDADERLDLTETLLKNQDIQEMMAQLDILDDTQMRHLLADDIQEHFVGLKTADDNSFSFFGKKNDDALAKRAQIPVREQVALKQRGAEFNRCIYGLNKGTNKDFIDAFLSALPDLWVAITSAVSSCFTPTPSENPGLSIR